MNDNDANGQIGLTSGFDKLDAITSGWQNGDFIVIAGRPAMGKTAFLASMICRMAVENGIPVAVFSLELSNHQLVRRLMTNILEISDAEMSDDLLEQDGWTQQFARLNSLTNAPIYIDDTPQPSVHALRTKAFQMVRKYKVKCIMIDYLQLINASGMNVYSRQQIMASISRSLKVLVKQLNIPVIALSQLNRGVERPDGYYGKRPMLIDFRESFSIVHNADVVCFIHRPVYYGFKKDVYGRDISNLAEFIIAKNNNGQIGSFDFLFCNKKGGKYE